MFAAPAFGNESLSRFAKAFRRELTGENVDWVVVQLVEHFTDEPVLATRFAAAAAVIDLRMLKEAEH